MNYATDPTSMVAVAYYINLQSTTTIPDTFILSRHTTVNMYLNIQQVLTHTTLQLTTPIPDTFTWLTTYNTTVLVCIPLQGNRQDSLLCIPHGCIYVCG